MDKNNLNDREANVGAVKEILMLIPNLLKLLYRLLRDEAVTVTDKALLVGTIAYVISPWDFLPDVIPLIGQLDDLFLMSLVLKRIMDSVPYSVLTQYWDGSEDLLRLIEKITNFAVQLLPQGIYQKLIRKSRPAEYTDVDYEVK